jgi:hypothetical protein
MKYDKQHLQDLWLGRNTIRHVISDDSVDDDDYGHLIRDDDFSDAGHSDSDDDFSDDDGSELDS